MKKATSLLKAKNIAYLEKEGVIFIFEHISDEMKGYYVGVAMSLRHKYIHLMRVLLRKQWNVRLFENEDGMCRFIKDQLIPNLLDVKEIY